MLFRSIKRSPLISLCFLFCLSGFALSLRIACINYFNDKQTGQEFLEEQFGDFLVKDNVPLLLAKKQPGLETKDSSAASKLFAQIYSNRESAYRTTSGKLSGVLFTLIVLTVVGIFILFFQPKELEIPVIKIALPDKLFYIVLPIVIIYLWMQLGLLMNASIDSRMVLERMTDSIETIGDMRVSYYHSNARTLVDQGFVDTWCTWYYDVFEGGRNGDRHQENAGWMLFLFFGTFWGLTLATCFSLISVYYETYKNKAISILLILIAGVLFVGWTLNMIAWYPHAAFLASCMWGNAILALLLWNIFGKKYAERLGRKRVEKEQRSF